MTERGNLILLAYSSVATRHFDRDSLVELLTFARNFNDSHGLTGMLLYVDESFFQILEGEPDELHALYVRIEHDSRHTKVIKVLEMPIEKRTFARWSMGYAKVTREELATIPGLNDFFGRGSALTELEAGKAKVLLDAFREGKWRRRLGRDA
jgi:Sensors of blue-light using FAD